MASLLQRELYIYLHKGVGVGLAQSKTPFFHGVGY